MLEFQQGGDVLQKYLPVLRQTPFFQGLTDDEILSVLRCVDAKTVQKPQGAYLFHMGDRTDSMGLVLSGAVLVIQEDLWGSRNVMAKIGPGEFFGESFAVLPEAALNVSVVVQEECVLLLLSTQRLLTLCPSACAHHSRIIRNLVTVLASKNLQFNEKLTHMSKRTTRKKLLSYLSAEAIRQGSQSFSIPYDRQQLADYLCVERAAMCVELSRLQREGILKTNRNQFVLYHVDLQKF